MNWGVGLWMPSPCFPSKGFPPPAPLADLAGAATLTFDVCVHPDAVETAKAHARWGVHGDRIRDNKFDFYCPLPYFLRNDSLSYKDTVARTAMDAVSKRAAQLSAARSASAAAAPNMSDLQLKPGA